MPLIVVTGLPLSGKTSRSKELVAFLTPHFNTVRVVNEEELGLDKKLIYVNQDSEKKARGAIISAAERHLTPNDLVIVDSLNYIKGFRYQIYCISKSLGTPQCTLYCGSDTAISLERNKSLGIYSESILANVCSRYEEPEGRNRWDAPLFTIIAQDESLVTHKIGPEILAALLKKAGRSHLSTATKPLYDSNYLGQVDKVLGDMIDFLITAQKNNQSGDIKILGAIVTIPPRFISLQEFRRLKRQYLKINSTHAVSDVNSVANAFASYLTESFL